MDGNPSPGSITHPVGRDDCGQGVGELEIHPDRVTMAEQVVEMRMVLTAWTVSR